jgi:transcriptional regulator with XRE-family HTH domain
MKLSAYLSQDGKNATVLAKDCGVSVSAITRLANEKRVPSLALALKIAKATGGDVAPTDFEANVQRAAGTPVAAEQVAA